MRKQIKFVGNLFGEERSGACYCRKDLRRQCKCEIISDFSDYFYDKSYFYDTRHHLSNEGTVMRTEQLISDLESYFSK